jgi:hypothetical protein
MKDPVFYASATVDFYFILVIVSDKIHNIINKIDNFSMLNYDFLSFAILFFTKS